MSSATLAEQLPTSARAGLALAALALVCVVARHHLAWHGPVAVSYALLAAAGLLVGFMAGLLGIGGAVITIPALYLALPGLGIAAQHLPATAVATALVAMAPTTIVAAWRQHRRGALELGWLRRLVVPMSLGACVGVAAATWLNGSLLALLFAAQSLYSGGRLIVAGGSVAPQSGGVHSVGRVPPALAGLAMAAFAACLGMGGGSMTTQYLQCRGVAFRQALATSSALNLCISLGGSAAFLVIGGATAAPSAAICWPAALLLGGGAVLTVSSGVALAHRLTAESLAKAVGATFVLSALILVVEIARG